MYKYGENWKRDLIPELAEITDFNCAGFALGIFIWLEPVVDDNKLSRLKCKEGYIFKQLLKEIEYLKLTNYIRPIKHRKDLKEGEYLVYFRCSPDGDDFHFVREHKGRLFEKHGEMPPEELIHDTDLINSKWDWTPGLDLRLELSEKTFLLAVKESIRGRSEYISNMQMFVGISNEEFKKVKETGVYIPTGEEIVSYPSKAQVQRVTPDTCKKFLKICNPYGYAASWVNPNDKSGAFIIDATKFNAEVMQIGTASTLEIFLSKRRKNDKNVAPW